MDAKQFVACWKAEKDSLVEAFTSPASRTQVAAAIDELNLLPEQRHKLRAILDAAFTDTFYTSCSVSMEPQTSVVFSGGTQSETKRARWSLNQADLNKLHMMHSMVNCSNKCIKPARIACSTRKRLRHLLACYARR